MIALISQPGSPAAQAALRQELSGMTRPRIGYIAAEPDPQWHYFEPVRAMYRRLGAGEVHYLELEQRFDADTAQRVLECDLIHLSGGNTYRFLAGLQARNLLLPLKRHGESGRALVGVSAGAMVLTPSIDTASLCGDPNSVELDDTQGANLLPFLFLPHAQPQLKTAAATLARHHCYPVAMCDDHSALLIQGSEVLPLGQPEWLAAPLQSA
ncbi:Type 1 glutamine amidotransferase-like domain-containing protein [Ferrimonas balearica]|uniref:Type 1 glutamine amidotransferase-like domain-containing protein n=1 Tax=Ferrimonas balearica TaxID=44012 RepID=UPI001C977BB1|nr:Type 1 glutamine amidotransferase-like domain-containing protein [Ferrimonas balearica]MBY6223141.1 Type 1 glutamine amidotransferase-like domain-containing protein [Ferrimonas balearica]